MNSFLELFLLALPFLADTLLKNLHEENVATKNAEADTKHYYFELEMRRQRGLGDVCQPFSNHSHTPNNSSIPRERTFSRTNLPPMAVNPPSRTKLYDSCNRPGVIALTYDDGPSQFTYEILDKLQQYNIPATFFVVGKRIAGREHLLRRMIDEGHVVASHTFNHANLSELDSEEIRDNMKTADSAFFSAIGKMPVYMRPPYLEYNAVVRAEMERSRYVAVDVNVDTKDWKYIGPSHTVETFQRCILDDPNRFAKSYIVLMHSTMPLTAQDSKTYLSLVKTSGLIPVTIEECIGINAYRPLSEASN